MIHLDWPKVVQTKDYVDFYLADAGCKIADNNYPLMG